MNRNQTQEPRKKEINKWPLIALRVLFAGSLSTNFFYISHNKALQQSHDREVLHSDSILSVKLMVDKQLADNKSMLEQALLPLFLAAHDASKKKLWL